MRTLLFITLGLVVLAALSRVLASRDTRATQRRFESLFRKPEKPARSPESGHYYKRYWE